MGFFYVLYKEVGHSLFPCCLASALVKALIQRKDLHFHPVPKNHPSLFQPHLPLMLFPILIKYPVHQTEVSSLWTRIYTET